MSNELSEMHRMNKIAIFNTIVGNSDQNRAIRYLEKSNWSGKQAVQLFLRNHPEVNPNMLLNRGYQLLNNQMLQRPLNFNPNIYNQNQQYPRPYYFQYFPNNMYNNNFIPFNFNNQNFNQNNNGFVVQLSFNYDYIRAVDNNKEQMEYFERKFNYVSKSLYHFISKLKTNTHGVIILYCKDKINEVKSQINEICNDEKSSGILSSAPILPLVNTSYDGKILSSQRVCISLPCYLFCKFKDDRTFFIINRIEGSFELSNFRDYLTNIDSNDSEKEKKNEVKEDNEFNLFNSIENLQDGEVLKKRENEMRELEKNYEEQIEKEKEDKERKLNEFNQYMKESEQAANLLPEEPKDDDPNRCEIQFNFPNGEKNVKRKLLKSEKIGMLYTFVKSLGREIFTEDKNKGFDIVQAFPHKNFENLKSRTLEEEGLFPNSMLYIKEKRI